MEEQKRSRRCNKVLCALVVFICLVSFVASPLSFQAGVGRSDYEVLFGSYYLLYGEYTNLFVGVEGDSRNATIDNIDHDYPNFLTIFNLFPQSHTQNNYYYSELDFRLDFSTHAFSHVNGHNGLFDPSNLMQLDILVYYEDGSFHRLAYDYVFDITNYSYRLNVECSGFKDKNVSNIQVRMFGDFFQLYSVPVGGSILFMDEVFLYDLHLIDLPLDDSDLIVDTNDKLDEQIRLTGNIIEDIRLILGYIINLPNNIGQALVSYFSSLNDSVDSLPNFIKVALSGLFNILSENILAIPTQIFNVFSNTLDVISKNILSIPTSIEEFVSYSFEVVVDSIGGQPLKIFEQFSTVLNSILDSMNIFSNSDHEFNSSDIGQQLDNLGNDLSVSKPSAEDVFSTINMYTISSGAANVASLLSIFTFNEKVLSMMLSCISFGLIGLIFFGKK